MIQPFAYYISEDTSTDLLSESLLAEHERMDFIYE